MEYQFKPWHELAWFVAVAVITTALQALVEFDPVAVTDYRAWAISLGSASIRAGAGAALAWLTRPVGKGR